jgi:hypothetical protein
MCLQQPLIPHNTRVYAQFPGQVLPPVQRLQQCGATIDDSTNLR